MKVIENYIEHLRNGKSPQIRDINTQGGILLPASMASAIRANMAEWPLQGLADRETVSHLKTEIPYLIGDVSVGWMDEGNDYADAGMEIGGFTAKLHKVGAVIKVSEELINDSFFNLENFIAEAFGRALGKEYEDVCINGGGVGKPTGFLMGCQKKTVTGAWSLGDLYEMYNALELEYRNNASWILSKNMLNALIRETTALKDFVFILKEKIKDNRCGDPVGFMLGNPCYVSLLPDENPIAFGDFSYYKIIEQLPVIQRLSEKYSKDGIVGFIMRNFIDARLLKSDAVIALEVN